MSVCAQAGSEAHIYIYSTYIQKYIAPWQRGTHKSQSTRGSWGKSMFYLLKGSKTRIISGAREKIIIHIGGSRPTACRSTRHETNVEVGGYEVSVCCHTQSEARSKYCRGRVFLLLLFVAVASEDPTNTKQDQHDSRRTNKV
jgi:hypothetical protein